MARWCTGFTLAHKRSETAARQSLPQSWLAGPPQAPLSPNGPDPRAPQAGIASFFGPGFSKFSLHVGVGGRVQGFPLLGGVGETPPPGENIFDLGRFWGPHSVRSSETTATICFARFAVEKALSAPGALHFAMWAPRPKEAASFCPREICRRRTRDAPGGRALGREGRASLYPLDTLSSILKAC